MNISCGRGDEIKCEAFSEVGIQPDLITDGSCPAGACCDKPGWSAGQASGEQPAPGQDQQGAERLPREEATLLPQVRPDPSTSSSLLVLCGVGATSLN